MTTRPAGRRPAFTLLELLLVIGIIVVLATLAVLFLPNLDRHKGVPNQVTQLHGWFNLMKQQAVRDGVPHGIRLIDDGGGRVTSAQYIEQPEPIAPRGPGIRIDMRQMPCYDPLIFADTTTYPGNVGPLTVVTLYQDPTGINPPGQYPPQNLWLNWDGVNPGDYFQLSGSPTGFAGIRRFTTPGVPTAPGIPPAPTQGPPFSQLVLDRLINGNELPTQSIQTANNFRVVRQPRPLVGEPMLQLHKDVYIDLTRSHPCPTYLTWAGLKQFPTNSPSPPFALIQATSDWAPYTDPNMVDINPVSGQPTPRPYLDILFSSNGSVANAPYGQVMLWVQRNEPQSNDALLLSIFTRTGKIGPYSVFDLNPAQYDPYGFARAGQTPGL